MRNIDVVREMPMEELVELILSIKKFCPKYENNKVYCDKLDCRPCLREWLEREEK